jgi:predicted site-specific integrase-resolvase
MSKDTLTNVAGNEPGFIDTKQLLARLPVSRRTLHSWRKSGKIPSIRLCGRRVLFDWESVRTAILRAQNNTE